MSWFIIRGNKLVGPATEEQICNLIKKGKILPNTFLQLGENGARVEASSVEVFSVAFEEYIRVSEFPENDFVNIEEAISSKSSIPPALEKKTGDSIKKSEKLTTKPPIPSQIGGKKGSKLSEIESDTNSRLDADGFGIPDYSNEDGFDEFIKKKQMFAYIAFAGALCCVALQPHFFAGNIKLGIMRTLILLFGPFCVGFAPSIYGVYEFIIIQKMSDNEFYHMFKGDPKLIYFKK